jgi:anti-anti-sigma factor
MKTPLMASAVSVGPRSVRSASASVTSRAPVLLDGSARATARPNEQPPTLTSVGVWKHTLILTGALEHHSAHELEAEIERLCDEGVTSITLDLRELTYIDSIGVAVIAFRSGLCKRRGYDFAVIPGSPLIHRAFEQAGVSNLLTSEQSTEEPSVPSRLPAMALRDRPRDGCEV